MTLYRIYRYDADGTPWHDGKLYTLAEALAFVASARRDGVLA